MGSFGPQSQTGVGDVGDTVHLCSIEVGTDVVIWVGTEVGWNDGNWKGDWVGVSRTPPLPLFGRLLGI